MGVSVIIERISSALQAGVLLPMPDHSQAIPVRTLADMVKPWEEAYPYGNRDTYGASTLRSSLPSRYSFDPQPRRSSRPLPAPARLTASHKILSPWLFDSVRAVWDWYESGGKGDRELLEQPCTADGLSVFLDHLRTRASDYHPMDMYLEDIGHPTLMHTHDLMLMIPHYTYEQEESGMLEGFLRGVDGLHSNLQYLYENGAALGDFHQELELPKKDHALIKEIGFHALTQAYYGYAGEKSADLRKLENFDETFFSEVKAKYPAHYARDFSIISGNGGTENEFSITCKEDIDFALAYAEAFSGMILAIPFDPYHLYDNIEGAADTFIHEVCEVWRKTNHKRPVKWVSPKTQTLAARFRKGEL